VELAAVYEGDLEVNSGDDFGLDLKGELWNRRAAVEGFDTCLKATETAKGRRRMNDIVAVVMGGTWIVDDDERG
jgi:hypothetical protein